jgi:uncharacterized membrane protein YphA (DoxX/SURF4 family)
VSRALSLLLLRVSMGLLMVWWGVDKLRDVEHGMEVSAGFYAGLFSSRTLLQGFGVLQIALGALVVLGVARRVAYPALVLVTATTAAGVWRSIVDPWGLWLEGSMVLFYPSIIILAAALVLWTTRDDDVLVPGGRRRPDAGADLARPIPG